MSTSGSRMLDRTAWALLCVLVFSLPLEKAFQFGAFGTVSRVVGQITFLAGIAAVVARRRLRAPNIALLLAAAFVLLSVLSWIWSVAPAATGARAVTMLQLLGMTWLIWELCRDGSAQFRLVQLFVAGAAVSSLWTIVRAALNMQTYWRRYATAGFEPNDLGVTLAIALTFALYLNVRVSGWRVWPIRGAAVLIVAALLLTASRTALVAGLASIGFIGLAWPRSTWTQRISGLAILALLLLGAVRLAPSAARQRLATLPKEAVRGTFHDRTDIWKAGLRVLPNHPVLGVGAAAYQTAVQPWLGPRRMNAHNTFLSVLVETGVVGFAIWAALLATLAWFAWFLAPHERAFWVGALLVWAIGCSTVAWEHRKITWLVFALIMTEWARTYSARERAK